MSESSKGYRVGVVGATGAVGRTMLQILEQRGFPISELRLFASKRSAGKVIRHDHKDYEVEELTTAVMRDMDVALFSAGAARSKEFAPVAAKNGVIVVDNSSAFRMDPEIPLVVPEVNPEALESHKNIIANPNCSTIQLVVVLKPLHDAARIRRIVVSTYQSVSGAGAGAMNQLRMECQRRLPIPTPTQGVRPGAFVRLGPSTGNGPVGYRIAFNLVPQIDVFSDLDYTKEEWKMVRETQKILGEPEMKLTATCVRVPVFLSHSESVNIEFERELAAADAVQILSKSPGVEVVDDVAERKYPMPLDAAGKDPVYVGRIRKDPTVPNGLNLWVVSDNLRKGAALNAVQIAEKVLGVQARPGA
ncbi:MAG: aspartate-semialdehyde dehydrogenase [Candidatus Omnitrophica bacterium]|nr:aspartate-semialdehyde dehydrogenase [Candidatus Omnitrophota bacterium]